MPDSLPDDIDWSLLTRYADGACTPDERTRVEAWVLRDPTHAATLESIRRLYAVTTSAPPVVPVDAMWTTAARRVGLGRAETEPSARSWRRRQRAWAAGVGESSGWRRLATFGAGALAACAAIWLVMTVGPRIEMNRVGRVYATGAGQRETVTLPDGTQLTLAPASTVRLAQGYGTRSRELTLEGEAYFAVVHDAARPLTVRARNAVARDVGTRFVVRAYGDDDAVRVVVAEGAVALGENRERRTAARLSPGTLGAVTRSGVTTLELGADTARYLGWTAGRLVFHATALGEAAVELSRWYDLDVRVADTALARLPVTGSYTTESPDEVLSFLAAALGARVERHGRVVIIRTSSRGL